MRDSNTARLENPETESTGHPTSDYGCHIPPELCYGAFSKEIFGKEVARSRRTAFSHCSTRGSMFMLLAETASPGIRGHIALKLAVDKMTSSILSHVTEDNTPWSAPKVVEDCFREVNSELHRYASQMQLFSEFGTHAVIAAFDGANIVLGKVGVFSLYLKRNGKVFPLSAPSEDSRLLGVQATAECDLATFPAREGDELLFTSFPSTAEMKEVVERTLAQDSSLDRLAEEFVTAAAEQAALERRVPACLVMRLHPVSPVVELHEVQEEARA